MPIERFGNVCASAIRRSLCKGLFFPVGVHLGVVMFGVTCTWHGEFSRDAVLTGYTYTESETTPWSIPRLPKSRQVGKNTIVQVMKIA